MPIAFRSASRPRCWPGPGASSSSSLPTIDYAGAASPRGIFFLLPVSVMRRGAAGALQHHQESDTQKSRKNRPQILRRPAHSLGGRARSRIVYAAEARRFAGGSFRSPGWWSRPAGFSHGEHVALSQLQGDQPASAAVAAHRRAHLLRLLPDLEFWQPFLLALSTGYVASGILIRVAGIIRRRFRRDPPPRPLAAQHPSEQQVG